MLLSPNRLFIPNLQMTFLIMRNDNLFLDTHLVDPLVSRGKELNFVVISVDVSELFLDNVGMVLCGMLWFLL